MHDLPEPDLPGHEGPGAQPSGQAPVGTTSASPSVANSAELAHGELRVLGRITGSSNATFLAEIGNHRAVYKPVAGERPLWDFPDGTLAAREHATWLVAQALGWDVVPATILREGPYGPGSVQAWVEEDVHGPLVDLVPSGTVREGWTSVLHGENEEGDPVEVVHSMVESVRRLALLDVVVNNSDRKGGHVLTHVREGEVRAYGIDHGLTFHHDPKLRTVLWGWIGSPLDEDERSTLLRLHEQLSEDAQGSAPGTLRALLSPLLSDVEVAATRERVARLLDAGVFPAPDGGWPSIPWPAF